MEQNVQKVLLEAVCVCGGVHVKALEVTLDDSNMRARSGHSEPLSVNISLRKIDSAVHDLFQD